MPLAAVLSEKAGVVVVPMPVNAMLPASLRKTVYLVAPAGAFQTRLFCVDDAGITARSVGALVISVAPAVLL